MIRVVYDRKTLPLNSWPRPEGTGAVRRRSYVPRSIGRVCVRARLDPIRWIVASIHGIPDWASEGEVRIYGGSIQDPRTPGADSFAVRQGLGITTTAVRSLAYADLYCGGCRHRPAGMYGTLYGFSHRGYTCKTGSYACGSSLSSYPAGSPRTLRFSRGCPYRATDARQVAGDARRNSVGSRAAIA